jgi:ABC-type lipoprotein export system ATPase subunit
VLVTHNPDLAARYASRTLHIVDGRIRGGPAAPATGGGPALAQTQVRS